ncbi:MAG: DUF3108 domain-containing protein [Pseudomonadota bacterium]
MSTHDFDPMFEPRSVAGRRWRSLAVLSAATLLLHAALLGGGAWTWLSVEPAPLPTTAMQVRVVETPATAGFTVVERPARAEPPAAAAPAAPVVQMRPKPRAAIPARAARVAAPVEAQVPAAGPGVEQAAAMPTMQLALAQAAPATPAPQAAADEAIPHYRTRMPHATTLRYEVQRGVLHGTGELAWRPQGDRYELALDFKLGGLTILSQASTGGFDAAGVAPLRFVDQRFRRSATAANFQREAGKISYSGSPSEFPLRAGAQDRLSWMVQLAAIVGAEPRLEKPGATVAMVVTGSHGDLDVWVLRCVGPEAVSVPAGSVDAIKFVREPREPYDTTVQVWLDPQRQHLPVRATQKSGPNDDGYELRLLEMASPH